MSNFVTHITKDGDRWDSLALTYYGDALAYGRIIRANPGVPIDAVLPSGLSLRIPLVARTRLNTDVNLPPWRRS